MYKNIEEYISEYEIIKHQIDDYEQKINGLRITLDEKVKALEEQITFFNKIFEQETSPINDKLDEARQNLNKCILTYKTHIKLKDIINEISNITKINIKDIEISGHRSYVNYQPIESYKELSNKDEFIKYIAKNTKETVNVNINIYAKGQPPLNITFDGHLSDIQADGKTLLEHSKKRPVKVSSFIRPEDHKKIEILGLFCIIDKTSIENIICSFNLKQIVNFKNNCDNDLLSKAVIDCLHKHKYTIKEIIQTPMSKENNSQSKMMKKLKYRK